MSLLEGASSLKLKNGHMSKKNDELFGVYKKGGELLLSYGCPRPYHKGRIYIKH